MDSYQRRVLKLREHVLSQQVSMVDDLDIEKNFIYNINEAYELAIKEDIFKTLESKKIEELKELAKEKGIEGFSKLKKEELIAVLAGK